VVVVYIMGVTEIVLLAVTEAVVLTEVKRSGRDYMEEVICGAISFCFISKEV
jgi:hypothetical protein